MSKGFAIHNAITDHGGVVPSTQMISSQMGNLFVRAGDGHVCPKCRCWSTVIKSHDHVIFDGKPVAYVGDKLSCGATLLPQQSHVVGESGSPYSSSSKTTTQNNFVEETKHEYGQRFLLQDELTGEPLATVCYEIHKKNGSIVHGTTDKNGYTDLITSNEMEEIELRIISKEHSHG